MWRQRIPTGVWWFLSPDEALGWSFCFVAYPCSGIEPVWPWLFPDQESGMIFLSIIGYWKWIRPYGRHFYQAQCFLCLLKNACVMWLYLKWSTSVMHLILSKISGGDKVGICLKIQIKILFFQVRRFSCLASTLTSASLKQWNRGALKEMVLVMYFGI